MEKFFENLSKPSPDTVPLNIVERAFDTIGLMRGSYAPYLRVLFGFGLVSALEWYFKPNYAFDKQAPRPWRGSSGAPQATWAAWWVVAGAVGLSFGLFV